MTTRSTTQRVAARLLAGSRARWATSANTTSSATSTAAVARRIAAPMPSRSHNRSCVHAPPNQREATISTSPPRRRPRPAPGSLPGDRRHQPGQRRAVDLVGPRSCGSPWRPSSRSAGVLPSRIRRKLTRPGQPIAMRNSSTSAIGRTTGRRPSTSAPSSPRSTRASSPRRQTCRRSRSPRDRRATSNACKDGARPVDGGQKAGRRSYSKERTARTHPHMRLGRGSQRTREGEGPHVRAGTSNTGGRGAGDRPDSKLFPSIVP